MRVTRLHKKRSIFNRLAYWLYERFCDEPYMPEGKISVVVNRGIRKGETKEWKSAQITFLPDHFVPGIHELNITDGLNGEVRFFQDLFKKEDETIELIDVWMPVETGGDAVKFPSGQQMKLVAQITSAGKILRLEEGFALEKKRLSREELKYRKII